MKKILALVIFVIVFVGAATVLADSATWTVNSLNTVGCNAFNTGFTTTVSGISSFPTTLHFRTIVDAGGLRYMDEDAGTPSSNGNYGWHLYNSSSGGPTTATFPLPADTPITVHFRFINGTGGPTVFERVVVLSKCNGGTIVGDTISALGASCAPLPLTAVVGRFTSDAVLDWAPGKSTEPNAVIPAGNSAWVLGVDSSGQFYKIVWSCEYRWVPVGTMGPNYDNVWQGRPLPLDVVS